MIGEELKQARLKKLMARKQKRLKEAFDSYSTIMERASKVNINSKLNPMGTPQQSVFEFEEDLASFKALFNYISIVELLAYDKFLIDIKNNPIFLEKISQDFYCYPALYNELNRFFPYHLKHPYFESLLAIEAIELPSNDWQTCQKGIQQLKQTLYSPDQQRAVNDFIRGVKKSYHGLNHYIESLYRSYPDLCVIEAMVSPIVDLQEKAPDTISTVDVRSKEAQAQLSSYTAICKAYQVFVKKLTAHTVFGAHLVGYFWKLRHSVLTGYFYQLVLFFDNRTLVQQFCSSQYRTSLQLSDQLVIMPFKLIDRLDLEECVAGTQLMDHYLKLKPYDSITQKTYHHDRIFGKGLLKSNQQRLSQVQKQQEWQPL